jgi:hypothetical protein
MKKIENRTMEPAVEGGKGATYAEMCRTAINNVPRDGFTVDEMRKRLKIMDALDAAKDKAEIDIEDADLATLKHCVSEVRWIRLDKAILAFVDYIQALA